MENTLFSWTNIEELLWAPERPKREDGKSEKEKRYMLGYNEEEESEKMKRGKSKKRRGVTKEEDGT